MPGKEIHIPASKFLAAIRQRLEEDTKLVELAALDTAARGVAKAVEKTDELGLVDQSHYRLGWKFHGIVGGALMGNDTPHSAVIEHGRRPGAPGPPYRAILEWVQRKLVGNGQVRPEDAKEVAWAIQRAIHLRGQAPKKVLFNIQRSFGRWLVDAAVRQLRRKAGHGG